MKNLDETDLDVAAILGGRRSASWTETDRRLRGRGLNRWAGLSGFGLMVVLLALITPRVSHPPEPRSPSLIRPVSEITADMMVAGPPSASAIKATPKAAVTAEAEMASEQPRRLRRLEAVRPRTYARAAPLRRHSPGVLRVRTQRAVDRETRMASLNPESRRLTAAAPQIASAGNLLAGVHLRGPVGLTVARAERTEALDDIWIIRQR